MAKKNIRYAGEHQAALGKLLRDIARHRRLWEVFADFVALCALAISNSADLRQFREREAEYMHRIKPYSPADLSKFAEGLALVRLALANEYSDFLGSLYMFLELGNSWRGQIFTPYSVCKVMASLTMPVGELRETIDRAGHVTVLDPAVGGGAMLIATAEHFAEAGFEVSRTMHATAVDVDLVAVHMCYVQLSLLGVPATVVHGNSLTLEQHSVWYTPAHVFCGWTDKLTRKQQRGNDSAQASAPKDAHTFAWPVVARKSGLRAKV